MSKKNKQSLQASDSDSWNEFMAQGHENHLSFITRTIVHTMINSSKFLCIATNEQGIVQLFNAGAQLKLGYKAAEVINKLSIVDFHDPKELIARADKLSNEFKTPVSPDFETVVFMATRGKENLYTLPFICKNGDRFLVDISATSLIDDQGKIVGYLFIGTGNTTALYNGVLHIEIENGLKPYIENAQSSIFIIDGKGNYVLVNDQASKASGYSKTELLKKNQMDLIHPRDRAKAAESFQKLLEVGHATLDCCFLTKKGEERFWTVNIQKIQEDRYLSIILDITDQIRTREDLKRTNSFMETIIENLPDMLFLKDAKNLRFVQFNRAGEELTGISRDELLGKSDYDFFPKEEAEFFRKKDLEVLKGKVPVIIEEELIQTRYKGERILQTKKIPIFNAKGEPEYLLGFSEDITARKKAEKEFREQKWEVDNFFSLSPNLLFIADMDFSFRKLNIEWQKILGYSIDELALYKFIDLVHPEDVEQTRLAMTTLSTDQPIINYRNRYRRKDGTYIWIEWQVVSTGNLIYTIGQDISRKMFYEEELRKSKEAAEAANRAKSDFLANMSHEIRNPLNAIIGFAELLHNAIKDEKLLSQVDSIRNSGKNLLGILNDILDLSKIEAGKMKLEFKPVNLNFLLRDIENMFVQRMREKGLLFTVEKDNDNSLKIVLDEVRLHQILFNLIGNALKFTEKGSISLTLNKVYKSENSIDLTISIQDTGIGIPKEQHQLIFETFQQQEGQSIKKFGGTGLGLSISKRLAEMMGGKIALFSEPGKGSTFKVILYDVKIQHEAELESKNYEFELNTIMFENSKVLIVEDSEINLNLIVMTLENSNLNLLTAKNGKEAIEMTRKHHPDLILMDLRMPLMNGFEAAKIIKSDERNQSIPIIAISASTDLKIKCGQSVSLFSEYLMKPYTLAEFAELLKKYLPFKTVEIAQQAESVPSEIFEMTDEQKLHLIDVINVLETEFLPINESVIKKQLIEQIEFFGKGLVLFGEANSLSIIIDYGKKICHHVDNFEIDKMMKTLKSFPDIIEKIKALNRS